MVDNLKELMTTDQIQIQNAPLIRFSITLDRTVSDFGFQAHLKAV